MLPEKTKDGFAAHSVWHKEHQEKQEIINGPFETGAWGREGWGGAQQNKFLPR